MDVMDGSNMNNEMNMNERTSSKGSSKINSKNSMNSMNSGVDKIPYIRGEVRFL